MKSVIGAARENPQSEWPLKHGIKECNGMTDLLLAFLFGFAMGGGLLAIMLKSICREDRKDENDEN